MTTEAEFARNGSPITLAVIRDRKAELTREIAKAEAALERVTDELAVYEGMARLWPAEAPSGGEQ